MDKGHSRMKVAKLTYAQPCLVGNTMPPVSRLSIQNSVLPCGYHQALVSGLALLPRLHSSCRSETRAIECPALKAVVIGLGGGGLGMFLHHHFQIVLDMIELDPAVVDIAKKWFNFYESKDVNMFVGDGVARIKSLADTVSINKVLFPKSFDC